MFVIWQKQLYKVYTIQYNLYTDLDRSYKDVDLYFSDFDVDFSDDSDVDIESSPVRKKKRSSIESKRKQQQTMSTLFCSETLFQSNIFNFLDEEKSAFLAEIEKLETSVGDCKYLANFC